MDAGIDHYKVLGLPSGEEGCRVSEKEIARAFKRKALELHPDKRPDDPSAKRKFQKLVESYEILKDDDLRSRYDSLVRMKREAGRRRRARKMAGSDRREGKSGGAPAAARGGAKRRKGGRGEGNKESDWFVGVHNVVLRDSSNCPCCAERRKAAAEEEEEGRKEDFMEDFMY